MLLFFLGLVLGAALFGWLYYREQKRSSENRERAELYQQEKMIVVEFIHSMIESLGMGLSREALFQRIAHASIVSTGALSACVFELSDRGTLRSVALEGLFPPHRPLPEALQAKRLTRSRLIEEVLRNEELEMGEGVAGKVAATGKAILIEDGRTDPRVVKHADPALAVSTMICAPIAFRGEVIGVLAVCNSADGMAFSETDFSVVQSLAEQAGIAVHHNEYLALQLERQQIRVDLALARQIQLMLVPQSVPSMPGCELDGRYVSSHSVGGDLYDVIELSQGVWGVAVADVSGKGIPGALLMAICRTNLRHFARVSLSPSVVLKAVNHAMSNELDQGMYITMLYAVVDLNRSKIVYVRAGHERPLICREDRQRGVVESQFPESEGMPIGLVPTDLFEQALEEKELVFEVGDVFVAFTDGLTETANRLDKEFSSARLADTVKSHREQAPAAINEAVLQAAKRFSGKAGFEDDVTLVTLKRV